MMPARWRICICQCHAMVICCFPFLEKYCWGNLSCNPPVAYLPSAGAMLQTLPINIGRCFLFLPLRRWPPTGWYLKCPVFPHLNLLVLTKNFNSYFRWSKTSLDLKAKFLALFTLWAAEMGESYKRQMEARITFVFDSFFCQWYFLKR